MGDSLRPSLGAEESCSLDDLPTLQRSCSVPSLNVPTSGRAPVPPLSPGPISSWRSSTEERNADEEEDDAVEEAEQSPRRGGRTRHWSLTLSPSSCPGRRLGDLRKTSEVARFVEGEYAAERFFSTTAQISRSIDSAFRIDDSASSSQAGRSSTNVSRPNSRCASRESAASLNCCDKSSNDSPSLPDADRKRATSLTEPMHIFTSFLPGSSSPSPSRASEKQCFSPSMQQVVIHRNCFSPSPCPSPSPTRRVSMRSISPIAARPHTMTGWKRKCYDSDSEGVSSPKRAHSMLLGNGNGRSLQMTSGASLDHPLLQRGHSVNTPDSDSSNQSSEPSVPGVPTLVSPFVPVYMPLSSGNAPLRAPLLRRPVALPVRRRTLQPAVDRPASVTSNPDLLPLCSPPLTPASTADSSDVELAALVTPSDRTPAVDVEMCAETGTGPAPPLPT